MIYLNIINQEFVNDMSIFLYQWLSDRKKRAMQNKDLDVRRRVELIQDFTMPGVSTNIQVTKDGKYILASGIYKPRIRCYEVANLSMKFERCLDSEVVQFEVLSEDYSKIIFLCGYRCHVRLSKLRSNAVDTWPM